MTAELTQTEPRASGAAAPAFEAVSGAASGAAFGAVKFALRAEAGAALAASLIAYQALGGGWGKFALLFLIPDLSMLGYLISRRIGALCYNLGHSYLTPALAALAIAIWTHTLQGGVSHGAFTAEEVYRLALIWTAHIGFDRLLGYGLKYSVGFNATHLGWVGRAARGARTRA